MQFTNVARPIPKLQNCEGTGRVSGVRTHLRMDRRLYAQEACQHIPISQFFSLEFRRFSNVKYMKNVDRRILKLKKLRYAQLGS